MSPRIGLHSSSWGELNDTHINWLRDMGARAITIMDGAGRDRLQKLKDTIPDILIIVRLYEPFGPLPETTAFLAPQLIEKINKFRGLTNYFQVLNEPDIEHNLSAGDAVQLFSILHPRLKQACPWAYLMFPCPSVQANKIDWWKGVKPVADFFDGLAEHCYWETPDTKLDRQFGGRFLALHDVYPNKPIFITEFGWKTGLNVSPFLKGQAYKGWLNLLPDYVQVAAIYRLVGDVERSQPGSFADVTNSQLEVTEELLRGMGLVSPTPTPAPMPLPKFLTHTIHIYNDGTIELI